METTHGSDGSSTVGFLLSNYTTLADLESFSFKRPLLYQSDKLKAGPGDLDIFAAKTPTEISAVYNKLLVTVGKWNADMYLKIKNKLNEDSHSGVPPVCPEFLETIRSKKCMFDKGNKPPRSDRSTNQHILKDCKPKKVISNYPKEEPEIEIEPTYKNIFKNAKNNRKPYVEEEYLWTFPSSTSKVSHVPDLPSNSSLSEMSPPKKPCILMPNKTNNYLVSLREKRNASKKRHSRDLDRPEGELDTIAALFQDIPVKNVLHQNLEEQVELTKATIGERLIKVDPEDELKGFNYMKKAMLGAEWAIEEFQSRLCDGRWRKKFEMDKIELSDEEDTIDVSEIDASDSSSLCTGDSLNTSIDGKNRPPKPSRIPYFEEVHRKKDWYYDAIAKKWEKVVKKNLIEPNLLMTPIFRGLYTDIRVRSSYRHYDKILQSLNAKFEDIYPKTFVPYKHRLTNWIKKDMLSEEKAHIIASKRELIESAILQEKMPYREPKVIDYTPTKYLTSNQKTRLKCIMKDVENREEEGLTDWRKQALVEEYVNLHPMIATKWASIVIDSETKNIRNLPATVSKPHKPTVEFWQPLMEESSIYLDLQSRRAPPSKESKAFAF